MAKKKTKKGTRVTFSREKKIAVSKAYLDGVPATVIHKKYGISVANIYAWAKIYEELGDDAFLRGASEKSLNAKEKGLLAAIGKVA